MSGPRVLLMRLSCRTSAKATKYLSGFLGAARVVAFKAKEPDRYGNEQWELYAQEPPPKDDSTTPTRNPERGQRIWDRSRDVERHVERGRAQAAGEAILAERHRSQESPPGWLDDSAEAIRDLTEVAGR